MVFLPRAVKNNFEARRPSLHRWPRFIFPMTRRALKKSRKRKSDAAIKHIRRFLNKHPIF
jgi:hypothetical protein